MDTLTYTTDNEGKLSVVVKECDYMCVSYKVFGVNLHDELIGDSAAKIDDAVVNSQVG